MITRLVVASVAALAILAATGGSSSAESSLLLAPRQPSIVSPSTTQAKLITFATFVERSRSFRPLPAVEQDLSGATLLGRYHAQWLRVLVTAGLARPDRPQLSDREFAGIRDASQAEVAYLIAKIYAAIQLREIDALVWLPTATDHQNQRRLECLSGVSVATSGGLLSARLYQNGAFMQGFTDRQVGDCLAT